MSEESLKSKDAPISRPSRSRLMSQRFSRQILGVSTWDWNHQVIKKRRVQLWQCRFGWWRTPDFSRIHQILGRDNKEFQYLELIHLNCKFGCRNSDEGIRKISHCFKGLAALKSLCFIMGGSAHHRKITRGWWCLSEGLKRFYSLEELAFCFDECHVKDENLELFWKGFRRHTSLKRISLLFTDIRGHEISDIGVYYVGKGLKNLIFLQSLRLNFEYCDSITDEGLAHLQKCLKKLKNLREVYFWLEGCTKTSLYGVEQMTQAFTILPLLQDINLKIFGYSYSIKNLEEITFSQKIDKYFWQQNTKVEFKSLQKLLNNLLVASQESYLEYDYDTEDFYSKRLNRDLETFALVQSVSIKFGYHSKITDQKLKDITESIEGLNCLIHLHLDFQNFEEVTDKGLQGLSKGFEALYFLQKIDLRFIACQQIADDGFSSLCDSFKNLVSLENIKFSFFRLYDISDSGIQNLQSLVESLKKLLALQEITLVFSHSAKISETGRDLLVEALENHISLQRASVNFGHRAQNIRIVKGGR